MSDICTILDTHPPSCIAFAARPPRVRGQLVKGIRAMLDGPEDFSGPVNLGNPVEMSMLDIAQLIIEATGSKSKIMFHPLPQDDPKRRKPDITLAKQKLDWEPSTSLQEGLKLTIEYFRTVISNGN